MNKLGDRDVSRETIQALQAFTQLVEKWNPKINLVSKNSLTEIWERHIIDSAQLFDHAPDNGHWADLGSGGGFPGIVVAALSKYEGFDHRFTLVESDKRKCAFLRTAARELELDVVIRSERIEQTLPLEADILSARALTNLDGLLALSHRHINSAGTALFPKGASWEKESADAQSSWSYCCDVIQSKTNQSAAILKIQDIKRV